MAYPIRASEIVDPNKALTVPFRPAAAGLVNVILTVVGIQPPPPDGGGAGSKGGQAPKQSHFPPFTTAVRLDVFKPGAAKPVATKTRFVNITSPDQQTRLIVSAQVSATAADLAADWSVTVTNTASVSPQAKYQLAQARCNVTVRYQVMPGNLGKIDHIVVLMMENRSFDHMLGYLSLPKAKGGAGRTNVDGLKGDEFNFDGAGQSHPVFHRGAPLPGQSPTSFLNDPGHGWNDVVDQLSPDVAAQLPPGTDPKLLHDSNGGFVRNFQKQLDNDAKETPPLRHTVHDDAQILNGDSRTIAFRPAQPGLLSVRSVATHPPRRAESGLLARIDVRRPGSNTPVAHTTAQIGQSAVGLVHQVTEAELATPGQWTCQVTNGTDADVTFGTDITYIQASHDTSRFEQAAAVMGYYTGAEVKAYDALATQFAICDQWYASLPTDTWPNRLYALTGGAGGMLETPSGSSVQSDPPGYTLKTIFEVLQEHQVDWEIFFSDLPFALIFKKLAQDATYTSRMRSVSELFDRAETGDLPSFAWIDPNYNDVPDDKNAASDDHPPGDVSRGQRLVAQVYNALSQSPAWSKTLFIITYDEHGGFFDHVLPPGHRTPQTASPPVAAKAVAPAAVPGVVPLPVPSGPPDDDPNMRVYGLRVPTLLVSPWVTAASVSKLVYDHTSLLSTILHRFCAAADGTVPHMGKRAAAANHVGSMLSSAAANLAVKPMPPPDATAVQGAVLDRNTFGVALHTALFRF